MSKSSMIGLFVVLAVFLSIVARLESRDPRAYCVEYCKGTPIEYGAEHGAITCRCAP